MKKNEPTTADGFPYLFDQTYWRIASGKLEESFVDSKIKFALCKMKGEWFQGQNPLSTYYAKRENAIIALIETNLNTIRLLQNQNELLSQEWAEIP